MYSAKTSTEKRESRQWTCSSPSPVGVCEVHTDPRQTGQGESRESIFMLNVTSSKLEPLRKLA